MLQAIKGLVGSSRSMDRAAEVVAFEHIPLRTTFRGEAREHHSSAYSHSNLTDRKEKDYNDTRFR